MAKSRILFLSIKDYTPAFNKPVSFVKNRKENGGSVMSIKTAVTDYVATLENCQVDHPFSKFPEYEVLRHTSNRKWFGLIMSIEKTKLHLPGPGTVEIIDIKIDPELLSILKNGSGYFFAYHMNKKHWLTVLLDGTVAENQVINLVKDSYFLTK